MLTVKEITEKRWLITRRVREGLDLLPPGRFRRVPETESLNTIGLELPWGRAADVIAAIVDQVKMVAQCCAATKPEPIN